MNLPPPPGGLGGAMRGWLRELRRLQARLPRLGMARVPDAPIQPMRDVWPGDAVRGARLLRGEIEIGGAVAALQPGNWAVDAPSSLLVAAAHGFSWLRDLREIGSPTALLRARALVGEWIANPPSEPVSQRPDVVGARIAAWLGHYDFFAATADDAFRQKLMARLLSDSRRLAAYLPTEEVDGRALTALKGLTAASVALPDHSGFLMRVLRFLPQELSRQVLADGCHAERSPVAHVAALQDLIDIRALLQSAQATPPVGLGPTIDRMATVLRFFRHGDWGLAQFNGAREEPGAPLDQVLARAGRGGKIPTVLPDGGFHRLQAGRTVMIVDCGTPPPAGLDRYAHAGTLGIEVSIGRERLVVNCGGFPAGGEGWRDATRATAAHSTLVVADVNSSELTAQGLGWRAEVHDLQRQEADGAHWLEASHDGWQRAFGAVHRRSLYLASSGDDIRGEDSVTAETPQPFVLRFHLHPDVTANSQQGGEAVLLRLRSGGGWRLRADGGRMSIEDSIYLGGMEPRRSEQVVITSNHEGPQQVKWAISKVG
jgi:uncharacterized heparinase superfamily protein